jgi:serralysin
MATDTDNDGNSLYSTAKGGLYGGPLDLAGLDPNVQATLMGYRWTTSFGGSQPATTIHYSFPTSVDNYKAVPGYPSTTELNTFQPVTEFQKAAVHTGLNLISSYTNLTFVETSSGLASDATLRFAQYTPVKEGSEARFPSNEGASKGYQSDSRDAGDMFLGQNAQPTSAYFGTDDFTTIIHEMGHAFGLKHGHDGSLHGTLAPQVNDNEFSVMTYASYLGSPTADASEARAGSSPTSYMMYDIAALQAMYGANFSKVGTKATYTWNENTGQQLIGGMAAPNTGVTSTNTILSTVWTQGATATYDLSNFVQDQVDDLRPGHFLKFSNDQLADLNSAVPADTPGYIAQGNIYNALLYHGDLRSAVANLTTGSGNDTLIGNDRDNVLIAGAGIDTIVTAGGNDTVSGGAGGDKIFFGSGYDVLRDTVADLNGDVVRDFGFGTVDVLGERFGWDKVNLNAMGSKATIAVDASTIELNGSFFSGNGAFIVSQRGSGADAHTAVSYVNTLPNLAEGRSVNPILINGVADQPFMTGDGAVRYTLELKSAVSAFANTLGVYKIAADGTISDVHVLFANTLNVAAGAKTVDLGVLGNGQHFGFFLIQDGANLASTPLGTLSFVKAGTGSTPAGTDNWMPPTLLSSTQGAIDSHPIFHSSASLNPNGSVQVLSGVKGGGQELQIGFEDLPMATGDRDYQDVVVGIHAHGDGFFFT